MEGTQRDIHTMTYAQACEPGSGFTHRPPIDEVCQTCGRKHFPLCNIGRDRRADFGSTAGQ